ncbi:hypothetical protein EVAR_49940_1 [Eumeta japonica]|uniref:Uncharacterized protein n=1 Tax=Eumeta variegata TaxID=151549 RepID=A0A4C1XXQ7_EUMVA|nr:hypothetical protein EVAR_49940_1 [Eumeta japonica]
MYVADPLERNGTCDEGASWSLGLLGKNIISDGEGASHWSSHSLDKRQQWKLSLYSYRSSRPVHVQQLN